MIQTLQRSKINNQDRETAVTYSITYATQLSQGKSHTYAETFAHTKVVMEKTDEYSHWYAQAMEDIHLKTQETMTEYFRTCGHSPETARQAATAFANYTMPKQGRKYALPYAKARSQGHSHHYAASYASCIRQGQSEEYARGYATCQNPEPVQLEMIDH